MEILIYLAIKKTKYVVKAQHWRLTARVNKDNMNQMHFLSTVNAIIPLETNRTMFNRVATYKTKLKPVICVIVCCLVRPYYSIWGCLKRDTDLQPLPKHQGIFIAQNNYWCWKLYLFCELYHYIIVTMFFILTILIFSILIHKEGFSVFCLCASVIEMF